MKIHKSLLTLGVLFSLWLGLILGCKSSTQTTGEPIKISAEDLFKAYQSNEADADRRYKGKTLIVTGTVGDANTKDREISFVDPQHTVLVYALRMAPDQVDAISKLKAGQKASVKGVCDGRAKMMGMVVDQVSLKDCVVQ